MNDERMVAVGVITTTQGHRGEVRILPFSGFPERYRRLKRVFIGREGEWKPYRVSGIRFHKQYIIAHFDEIPDMNTAETLRNLTVAVPEQERWPLPEGHYYIDDLIGASVRDLDSGVNLGTVKDVIETGSNSVLVLSDRLLIPMLKSVVMNIDLPGRTIQVRLPPGLVEEP